MFIRLKENLPCHSQHEPVQFIYSRGGDIELVPGVPLAAGTQILEFFAENHLSKVDIVDNDGNVVNLFNENGELDLAKLVAEDLTPKEIDFGGELVKPKKMKTSLPKSELNELIYGEKQ